MHALQWAMRKSPNGYMEYILKVDAPAGLVIKIRTNLDFQGKNCPLGTMPIFPDINLPAEP